MIEARAHVSNGHLEISGISDSRYGLIPFCCSVKCDVKDGPVNLAEPSEEINEALSKAETRIMQQVSREKMKLVIEDTVLAARAGSQVAMSHLAILKEARKDPNNHRARLAYKMAEDYINRNPPVTFSRDVDHSTDQVARTLIETLNEADGKQYALLITSMAPHIEMVKAACVISHGPNLTDERIELIQSELSEENDRSSFQKGYEDWRSGKRNETVILPMYQLGRAVGLARCYQLVGLGKAPISYLSPLVGWELGENA